MTKYLIAFILVATSLTVHAEIRSKVQSSRQAKLMLTNRHTADADFFWNLLTAPVVTDGAIQTKTFTTEETDFKGVCTRTEKETTCELSFADLEVGGLISISRGEISAVFPQALANHFGLPAAQVLSPDTHFSICTNCGMVDAQLPYKFEWKR